MILPAEARRPSLPDHHPAHKIADSPVLAVGDGALGFWGALREVFPETRQQRCWFHYADVVAMPRWGREVLCGVGIAGLRSA
jgi:hypothetical protein